jgi:chemotaxis-related protein WspD
MNPTRSTEPRVLTGTGRMATGARCWSTIGVWGTERPRCSVLGDALHCRNCTVFRAAALEVLDRDLPDAQGAEWAEGLAGQIADEQVERTGVLIFRLGTELMALPLAAVVEIAAWRPVHSLPHRRDAALVGVVNVGGELRLCVSLEALFGNEAPELEALGDRGRLIVIGEGKPEWVVRADETLSVHLTALDALDPPPSTVEQSSVALVRGIFTWRDQPVVLLDADLVLSALRRRLT